MYFDDKKINFINEGAIFWLKNVFNHYTSRENKKISYEQAYDKLVRTTQEFNEAKFDEKLIFKKAHRALDEYIDKLLIDMKDSNMKDGLFPVDCKRINTKFRIKDYFDSYHPELSRIYQNEDDLFSLVYYAAFSDELFKSNHGSTMAIPLVIYRNGEANTIFATFNENKIYKLFTVTAYNSGLDGAYKCNLTEIVSDFDSY